MKNIIELMYEKCLAFEHSAAAFSERVFLAFAKKDECLMYERLRKKNEYEKSIDLFLQNKSN